MACFVYEALLLFGIGLVPGLVGAILLAWGGTRLGAWEGDTLLRGFAFAFYGVYFVWFWSRRGQTLPMQTWNIRVEAKDGSRIGPGRALARYLASWLWIAPAALLAGALDASAWQKIGAVGAWVVVYACLALLHPQRQFWHDALCGTRLVSSPERGG